MVIVLKVSFSPAQERILLIGSVQRDSLEPRALPAERSAEPESRPPSARRPCSHSRAPGHSLAQQPWGPDKVPIAREPPTLLPQTRVWGLSRLPSSTVEEVRVQSVAGYPGDPIQGDASWPGMRRLVQVTGPSSVSAPMLSLSVGHRPSPENSPE